MPNAADFRKDTLPVTAEKSKVGVAGGQETIDADMALGDHGMENAAHPDSGQEGGFVRDQGVAGAEQLAVRTQHHQFFGLKHHVALVAGEKG